MRSDYLDIDVAGLCSVIHTCTGCGTDSRCCCSSYEVCVSEDELNKIIGCMPEAAKYCTHLKSNNSYDNVFEQVGSNVFSVDTTEKGLCVFAYSNHGKNLCSLHSVSIDLGLPGHGLKPRVCSLWPLIISEGEPKTLSIHEDAFDFTCNIEKYSGSLSLCPSVVAIVESVFDNKFECELQKAANNGLPWTRIQLPSTLVGDLWR